MTEHRYLFGPRRFGRNGSWGETARRTGRAQACAPCAHATAPASSRVLYLSQNQVRVYSTPWRICFIIYRIPASPFADVPTAAYVCEATMPSARVASRTALVAATSSVRTNAIGRETVKKKRIHSINGYSFRNSIRSIGTLLIFCQTDCLVANKTFDVAPMSLTEGSITKLHRIATLTISTLTSVLLEVEGRPPSSIRRSHAAPAP